MKLAALLTTVSHPQKQEWLMQVVVNLESLDLKFDKKIISVDKIHGYEFSKQLQSDIERLGWEFSFVEFGNRPKTLLPELLKLHNYDYILYAEDDILINWCPDVALLNNLLSYKIDNKSCGILTPSAGGSTFKCEGGDTGDFDFIERETIYENANLLVFKRLEEFASSWFFELGTIFIKPILFYNCLKKSVEELPGTQIEQGLTVSWFNLGYHESFFKATFCRPCIKQLYKEYPQLVDPVCKFMSILDPYAGDSRFGGSHHL